MYTVYEMNIVLWKHHIKGPKKRTGEDDEHFAQAFEKMVRMAMIEEKHK